MGHGVHLVNQETDVLRVCVKATLPMEPGPAIPADHEWPGGEWAAAWSPADRTCPGGGGLDGHSLHPMDSDMEGFHPPNVTMPHPVASHHTISSSHTSSCLTFTLCVPRPAAITRHTERCSPEVFPTSSGPLPSIIPQVPTLLPFCPA